MTVPKRLLLRGCVFLLSACATPTRECERDVVLIAQVVSSTGVPFGGSCAVKLAGSAKPLAFARVDCSGRVRIPVRVSTRAEALTLLVLSEWMRRNTFDERVPSVPVELLWHGLRSTEVGDLLLHSANRREDFSETFRARNGRHSVDLVQRTVPMSACNNGTLDAGVCRFATKFPYGEVSVDVVLQTGGALDGRIVLSGLAYNPRTMFGNMYYPHFALSQQGRAVRIVLTRAAWRLLRANEERLLQLQLGSLTGRVTFTPDQITKLREGERNIRARCVLPSTEGYDKLTIPPYWNLGEPPF